MSKVCLCLSKGLKERATWIRGGRRAFRQREQKHEGPECAVCLSQEQSEHGREGRVLRAERLGAPEPPGMISALL